MDAINIVEQISSKEAWIEPSIQQLHVSETAGAQGSGGDGQTLFNDCTKS